MGVLEPPPTTPAGREEVRQPATSKAKPQVEEVEEEEEEEEDLTEMQSRLQALKS